jgi:hypothetical protein
MKQTSFELNFCKRTKVSFNWDSPKESIRQYCISQVRNVVFYVIVCVFSISNGTGPIWFPE